MRRVLMRRRRPAWLLANPSLERRNDPPTCRSAHEPLDPMRVNTAVTWLSPIHKSSDFTKPVPFEKKVELFHARILGWQLEIADECANGIDGQPPDQHSGFAVLHLCLSYFETIAKYEQGYTGEGESKKHFKLGLASVFPSLRRAPSAVFERRSELLYKAGRCGLYHGSQTSKGILLGEPPSALRFAPTRNYVQINSSLLPKVLKRHFERYCNRLLRRRSKVLRHSFELRFNHDNPNQA